MSDFWNIVNFVQKHGFLRGLALFLQAKNAGNFFFYSKIRKISNKYEKSSLLFYSLFVFYKEIRAFRALYRQLEPIVEVFLLAMGTF